MSDTAPTPWRDDGTLDESCRDYDLLEREHKHSTWTADERRHFEIGWSAAVRHYQSAFGTAPACATCAATHLKAGVAIHRICGLGADPANGDTVAVLEAYAAEWHRQWQRNAAEVARLCGALERIIKGTGEAPEVDDLLWAQHIARTALRGA